MSRARTFLKCEIADAIAAAALHGMEVRLLADGEMRILPFTLDQKKALNKTGGENAADMALEGWEKTHGDKIKGRS
ncbi:MAG: hypothetical protein U5K75_08920 [Ahrensia sp.]|nr:hypothetical protein [Ahrensia sp.]